MTDAQILDAISKEAGDGVAVELFDVHPLPPGEGWYSALSRWTSSFEQHQVIVYRLAIIDPDGSVRCDQMLPADYQP